MLQATNKEQNVKLTIEDAGNGLGYYLYVFDLDSDVSKADHLCDDLQQAFLIAEEDYNLTSSEFKTI